MRYGVIADVHGNVHALSAVLSRLADVDGWICAGDLVGYGPRPNECVERVAALQPVIVAGNHDLMAVDRLPSDDLGPLPRRTMEWTRSGLSPDARSFLERLPRKVTTDEGVVIAHGSLDDPSEYVRDCDAARAQLERVPEARALVLGHTHHPLECDGRFFNPGSVGQSRERRPVARAMILTVGDEVSAEFVEVEYDVKATKRELRVAGLPPDACHLAPGLRARLRRYLSS